MNIYEFSACMDVETDAIREQNIAMDRVKLFLNDRIESCVFIQDTEKKIADKYIAAGLRVCPLPVEPYDQMITIMLLLKMNAIMEGRMIVTDITLGSKLGDGVNFLFDIDAPIGPFENLGWWHDIDMNFSPIKQPKKDKVVNLFNKSASGWADYNLDWKEKSILIPDNAEIVFITEPK
jgi:hypothetical protein